MHDELTLNDCEAEADGNEQPLIDANEYLVPLEPDIIVVNE